MRKSLLIWFSFWLLICGFILYVLAPVAVEAAATDRYWVPGATNGTGSWSDTSHWDEHSGGAGGDSVPTSADNVFFDVNSFLATGQVVTLNAAVNCKDLSFVGATNTPTFQGSADCTIYGSLTLIENMIFSSVYGVIFAPSGAATVLLAGHTLPTVYFNGSGSLTLQDDFLASGDCDILQGTLDTNGKGFTANGFNNQYSGASTVVLGASVITVGYWNVESGGTVNLEAGTSVLNVSGNFAGDGLTYNIVNLTGATCTISGSNTFAQLNLAGGTTQTITFTDGTIQTLSESDLSGSEGHVHMLGYQSSSNFCSSSPNSLSMF